MPSILPQPPTSQRAITQDTDGRPQITDGVALPPLLPRSVLVKTTAVALNPSDHKMGAAFPAPSAVVGMDFAGTVICIAGGTETDLVIGDTVCTAVHGSNPAEPGNGAFAEYVRARADMLLRVPASLGPVQAATLGTALATCIMALWGDKALGLSSTPDKVADTPFPSPPVLVYGGSTATGTIAIQLLKLSGYDPITTCSPHNFGLVRSRGASAVFDYTSPDVAAAIKTHTSGRLKYALDCIADPHSVGVCYRAIQRVGGRYASLELVLDEMLWKRRAVKPAFVMAPEVYGSEVKLARGYERPPNAENRKLAALFLKLWLRLRRSCG
ncbi:hypothetical protein DL769_001971 [Monosporascus sp. CRB-8-3]|nr:hypothetical protein DL769_001971 [Monosporascus sp. CRB-8-3]